MAAVLDRVDRAIERVDAAFALVAAVLVGLMTVLITFDVVGRAFGQPVAGTVALASSSVVAVTFLALPYAMRHGSHVRSMLVRDRLPVRLGKAVDMVVFGLSAATFAVIAKASWSPMLNAWASGEYTGEGSLGVPAWPVRLAVFLGSLVLVAECVLHVLKHATAARGAGHG